MISGERWGAGKGSLCTDVPPPSEKNGRRVSSPDFFSEGGGTSVHRLGKGFSKPLCQSYLRCLQLIVFRNKIVLHIFVTNLL